MENVDMKTAELTGAALDWSVAKCEGLLPVISKVFKYLGCPNEELVGYCIYLDPPEHDDFGICEYAPSTDWGKGGPIIEREGITLEMAARMVDAPIEWGANCGHGYYWASTPLIAAMRCYVSSKLGDEVDYNGEC
jgi:hypothetical protein